MEADRLRSGRLPEDVVLEDADAAIAGERRRQSSDALREHLRRDHGVRLPGIAELTRAILGVATGYPVHLVGADSRLVLPLEEAEVALSEHLQRARGHEAVFDDQEAVVLERLDLVG